MEMIADFDEEEGWVVRMRGTEAFLPQLENVKRIFACVNACAGMEDPATEIAMLKRNRLGSG